jgi:hypothetical protein
MRAATLALALLAAPTPGGPTAAPAPPAVVTLAERIAAALGAPPDGRRAAALSVETGSARLSTPLATALDAALTARGYVVTPLHGPSDAEAAARAGGQDWLVRVQADLVPGRRELGAVVEQVPTWPSFFLQRRPGARAVPPRLAQARVEADAETLLLARTARPAGAPFATLRPLARVAGRVLALAVGEPGPPGRPAVVAVTGDAVTVVSARGEILAHREVERSARRPVRGEAAVAMVADLGGGRIAFQHAGSALGSVWALEGDRLVPVATLASAPLCAGEGGALFGAFAPGTGLLVDVLSASVDPAARPRSERLLYGVAAAPRPGPVAFAALGTDLRLELLGPDLGRGRVASGSLGDGVPAALEGIGTGFALADLDGDGSAEVVASSADPSGPEVLRVLALRPGIPPLLELGPLRGRILSGAAGDLTGDGADDAVLGAVLEGDGALETELLLLTADPRETP